ncbi:MAG: amidotransferase [Chitinivibrionales bacterium]|nr:amidotransferase [Chitinivibrionales bacterium]
MRVQIIQHVPFEGPGCIADWAVRHGHTLATTHAYLGATAPDPATLGLIAVLGGPMGVDDDESCPWLMKEKAYIEEALKAETPVLGICLGAQLIAHVLGASVTRNDEREIGWFEVRTTEQAREHCPVLPEELQAFHWHSDTFTPPAGTVPVGASTACANQGFLGGRHIVGLQFHLESKRRSVADLVNHCRNELNNGRFVQSEEAMLRERRYYDQANRLMQELIDWLVGPQAGGGSV